MKRKNLTRNALFTSIISLLLCVSMLVGTTFAWFTDSVTSGVNTIAAGNLDVELYHGKDANPVDKVDQSTLLFTDVGGNVIDLWEPGVVAFTNLKVANVGTLALKYQLSVNSTEVNYVTTAEGTQLSLADALKVAVISGGVSGDRASVIAAGETAGWQGLQSFTKSGVLEGNETSQTYGVVIYWQPGDNSHDNLFNMNNGKVTSDGNPLKITLGVNLFATQEMYEDDSFGDDYDDEVVNGFLMSGEDIHKSTTKSGTFVLGSDIQTSNSDSRYGYGYEYIFRNGANYTLDLNGKTIRFDTVNENANHNALTYLFVANHVGTKLTINGEGKIYANNSEGYTAAIQGKDGTLINVNGGDYEVENGIAVWAGAGAHIIINDGSFVNKAAKTDHELIYSSGGVIDIYGGFFHNTDGNYTLNIEDRNRATGFINVYGGTFVNFDPSTGGQDPNNIKVADGYKVVSETQSNGDVWYTVVAG